MEKIEDQLLEFIGRIEDALEINEDVLLQRDEAKILVALMRQASNVCSNEQNNTKR